MTELNTSTDQLDSLSIAINEDNKFNALIDALDKLLIAENPDEGLCDRIHSINWILRAIADTGEISF